MKTRQCLTTQLLLFSLLQVQTIYSRPGETVEECDKRYAKPIKLIDDETYGGDKVRNRVYRVSDIKITCVFWRGKCVFVTYVKLREGEKLTSPLAENEDLILSNYTKQHGDWKKTTGWDLLGGIASFKPNPVVLNQVSGDGKLQARSTYCVKELPGWPHKGTMSLNIFLIAEYGELTDLVGEELKKQKGKL